MRYGYTIILSPSTTWPETTSVMGRGKSSGAPRGERELHMGAAYTAAEDAVPPSVGYVAMGHVHAPQPVPHANVPAEYAGSLLQLDFGEAGEDKRAVIVDIDPPAPAVVRSVPLRAGRPLVQASGTWDEIVARDDLDECYLDLTVLAEGPDAGLGVPVDVIPTIRCNDVDKTDRIARKVAAAHLRVYRRSADSGRVPALLL